MGFCGQLLATSCTGMAGNVLKNKVLIFRLHADAISGSVEVSGSIPLSSTKY